MHTHLSLTIIIGFAAGFITALLWWISGYKLVTVKPDSRGLQVYNSGIRLAGFAMLTVAALLLVANSAASLSWTFFLSWTVSTLVGVFSYYIVRYCFGVGRR